MYTVPAWKGILDMKILHLSDLHIGRSLGDFDLLEDQKYIFQQIADLAAANQVEAVLLAGDIYDRPVPSEGAVRLFDWFLRQLAERACAIYIISGNHDSDERLNFGSSFLAAQGIHIAAKYEGELYHHCLDNGHEKVNFYLLPFVKASQVKHFFPEAEIESYHEAVETILQQAEIDTSQCNVLLAHQFVAGKHNPPALAGSEGPGTQMVGLVEQIGTDCFAGFDYVALGHIHQPQAMGQENIRYAGSPLKYSLTECNSEKSAVLLEIADGQTSLELLPLKPRRQLRHLTGKLADLLLPENVQDTDDYIYITLTDEEPRDNAMNIVQGYYPNTVKLDYRNSHTESIKQDAAFEAVNVYSYQELLGQFYQLVYGQDIPEEELAIMEEIGAKAGLIEEKNVGTCCKKEVEEAL